MKIFETTATSQKILFMEFIVQKCMKFNRTQNNRYNMEKFWRDLK